MWTFSILGTLAIILTLISLRWRNILYSGAALISWLGLWKYNLSSPPTGIVVGSFQQDFLTYVFLLMAIATFLIYLFNRRRGYTGYPMTPTEQANFDRARNAPPNRPSTWSDEYESYRASVRNRIRPNRQRR